MSLSLRRVVAATVALALGACGASIPTHSGYKSDKAKPWKKPKVVKLDDKREGKLEDELAYADFKRARWFAIDVPSPGSLKVSVEASPAPPHDDEDFDLAMEIYDPGLEVLAVADAEADDAGELTKERVVEGLAPGRHLVHLYLQRRVDRAEFELRVAFTPSLPASTGALAIVPYPPRLPVVPLDDDTPAGVKPKPKPPTGPRPKPRPRPEGDKPPPPTTVGTAGPVAAKVINVVVVGSGTQITINRGTDHGLAPGQSGNVTGIKQGSFTLTSCTTRSCKATVKATPDEVNRSGKATVRP